MTVNFTVVAKIVIIMSSYSFLIHFFTTVKFMAIKKQSVITKWMM